ncbi:hypothetical protein FJY68_08880 [candidate division WOR-3 bacterium]|uniref:HTH HARE-type domain-containing protein n=1 Tax=candidate division WOR-3 bacterium TaxID=2052148 RepID=A0A938BQ94_UNCW3|nr:hypothetical protein [candidate division WOR-3 bacterium]
MTFKDAVAKVLTTHDGPMHTCDIWAAIVRNGLYEGKGKTPYRTMTSQLITDIARRGERSRFVRVGFGLYGLRKRGHRAPARS